MININETLPDETLLFGWKPEAPLTPFAPSNTHYFIERKIFSEKECKEWNTFLVEQEQILLDKFRTSTGDGYTGLGETAITSRFRDFNTLEFDFHHVSKLKTEIFKGIQTILSVSDNTNWQETLYANCWFNVLRKEESMNTHTHGYNRNSLYGFHLTINATETFTSYYYPIKFQEEAVHVPNKIGYITLFPNTVPHSVSTNKYETPRITIAGDIYASTYLNEDSSWNGNKNLVEIGCIK